MNRGLSLQADLIVKILCSNEPGTGLPVLRARDFAALGMAVASLWRPHPATRGGRSIIEEAVCALAQKLGLSALEPACDEHDIHEAIPSEHKIRDAVPVAIEHENNKGVFVAETPKPSARVPGGDWLRTMRRWESRFTGVHPDTEIADGGMRVTMHSGADKQWRTAMAGLHVMCRGRHYAEFTLTTSTRQGSITVGIVDSRFQAGAAGDDESATKTSAGWGYWAHSVSYRPPSDCLLPAARVALLRLLSPT